MEFNELDNISIRRIYVNTDDTQVLKLGKRLATTNNRNLLILNCKHESDGIRNICKIRMQDSRIINPDYIENFQGFFDHITKV
jgi:hypothetical protein